MGKKRKTEIFCGQTYVLDKNGYFIRKQKIVFLHRDVWEKHNGPIPNGMVLHHINGDKTDNRIENLSLLTKSEHMKIHSENPERKKRISERTKITWSKTEKRVFICVVCGNEFYSKCARKVLYCSKNCMQKSYKERKKIIKKCVICHKPFFTTERKNQTKTCSKRCAAFCNQSKEHKCVICGRNYYSKARGILKYCSKRCEKKNLMAKIPKNCSICGKVFLARKRKNARKTCSRKCANILIKGLPRTRRPKESALRLKSLS